MASPNLFDIPSKPYQPTSLKFPEAVDVMITLPSTTRDVGEQLSQEHAAQKVKNSHATPDHVIHTILKQARSCYKGWWW